MKSKIALILLASLSVCTYNDTLKCISNYHYIGSVQSIGFKKQNQPQNQDFPSENSEIFVNHNLYTASYTENSNLVVLFLETSFNSNSNDYHVESASISVQPRRYTNSYYYGGNVYYVGGFPLQSSTTYISQTHVDISGDIGTDITSKLSLGLSDGGLEIEKKDGFSFGFAYSKTITVEQPEPKVSTRLISSYENQFNTGYGWKLDFNLDDTPSYVFYSAYCFEIDNDKKGVVPDNQVSFEINVSMSCKQNTWWFPKTDSINETYYFTSTLKF